MQAQGIRTIKRLGVQKTLDFEVNHEDHNFYAEGIVVSNSHATGYAYLTAVTVWLKQNHPKEFFLSVLSMAKNEQKPLEEIAKIQQELHHFGIRLLPPHITKSDLDFTIEGGDVRFGLGFIKGVAEKSIEKLNKFRKPFANKFEVFQGAAESGLPIGILSALIQAGALEGGFKQSRSKVVLEAQTWNLLTTNEQKACLERAKENDFDLLKIIKLLLEAKNEKGKPIIKQSRFETIKRKYQGYKDIYDQNRKNEALANWFYEHKLMGYAANLRLHEIYAEKDPNLISVEEASKTTTEEYVYFIGVVVEGKEFTSKKKAKYGKFTIADERASVQVLVFNGGRKPAWDYSKSLNKGLIPDEDDIVIIRGTKKEDAIFAEYISIQKVDIYTKLSELKSKTKEIEDESNKIIDITAKAEVVLASN